MSAGATGPRRTSQPPRWRRRFCARDVVGHRKRDDAAGRLQTERHPAARLRQRRLSLPARSRGPPHGDDPRSGGDRVESRVLHQDIALDSPFGGDLVDAMKAALLAEDPDSTILPTACPAAPTTRPCRCWASSDMALRRCSCPGPRLRADVPRNRRARAVGVAALRCTRVGQAPAGLLTERLRRSTADVARG